MGREVAGIFSRKNIAYIAEDVYIYSKRQYMDNAFEQTEYKPFKFRELKVYSSTEWLADNRKKYRQVFDRYETSYVYAELSFFNKMYDQESWEVDVELACYSLRKQKKELCQLKFKRKVSKYDHTVFIREGWGNKKEGTFWKKGTYYWEARINGEKVATKFFYIEEAPMINYEAEQPYVDLYSLRLYEGQYDDVGEDDRTYFRVFSTAETRYIYAEIVLKNLVPEQPWQCELFTKFYNEARELKGQVTRLQTVKKDEEFIKITAGWGANVKGTWRPGDYLVDIVFMDTLLATIPFEVDDDFEEGIASVHLPNKLGSVMLAPNEEQHQTFEEVLVKLDSLVGLQQIKKQVREHAQYIQFLQLRKEKGFLEKDEINVHSVFIGNPGTGKTTVASMMGKLYHKMGLLTKGHVHEVDRVDLVGEYIGQTAPKVKEAIEKARGGVLFIDEAYSLARTNDDSKDFGREVIEILVKEMSNGPGDIALIVAGYPKEMQHFLDSNPGLKSRFKLHFHFDDYMPQELIEIAQYACKEKEIELEVEAWDKVEEIITEAFRNRDRTFGNARFVFDLLDKAKINLGLRVMELNDPETLSQGDMSRVIEADIDRIEWKPSRKMPRIPIDERLLTEALHELDSLIGMNNIKDEINELVRLVRYHISRGQYVLNNFYLHTVFVGNPGTGKTTVARILTKIYKALGILERGHMVETDRQGLVAGFVGQTAIKTAEKIEEAFGGVLFIDEAYALTSEYGASADYGAEAIQTILKRMEDRRGEFFVFAAGYPENMERFLKANPGLRSRFDKILRFDDYEPSDLLLIAEQMLKDYHLSLEEEARGFLFDLFEGVYKKRDKFFGNARAVRQMVLDMMKNQQLRLAAGPQPVDDEQARLILIEDIRDVKRPEREELFKRQSIGFNP